MTVFQVIECTGSYDDYHERVLGTYLNKDKAEDKIKQCERTVEGLRQEYEECADCDYDKPCYLCEDKDDGWCVNWTDYDEMMDATYKLKEFEVIE